MFILNNMKTTTKINQKSREREREETETETAKRPDWVMKSWIALNINEFILFDMFGSPSGRIAD